MIKGNVVVSLHYTLTGCEGQQLDSSEGVDPLTYMHGTGSLLPGLEQALEGHNVGDRVNVTLEPEQAYGEHFTELVQEMDLAAFGGQDLSVGMMFKAKDKNDQSQAIRVVEIHQNRVIVDANHPLAGQVLTFDVGVVAIRAPTENELARGVIDE